MFLRLYPKKNNTIFYTLSGTHNLTNGLINTGANPIMQLMEGNNQSELVLQFFIDNNLYNNIINNNTKINLTLYDAGHQPEYKQSEPKTVQLFKNEDDFIEGEGYHFEGRNIIKQNSNYQYRNDDLDSWSNKSFVTEIVFNKYHEDLKFEINKTFITNGINTFFIKYKNPILDKNINFCKSINSNKTRTIKLPYLEIDIDNEILDNRNNFILNENNKIYLLSSSGKDFSQLPEFNLLDIEKNIINSYLVEKKDDGVYYVNIDDSNIDDDNNYFESWSINNKEIYRGLINTINPDLVLDEINDMEIIKFYPTTKYANELIMWGDIVFMRLVLHSRGNIDQNFYDNFEFRLVCTNSFEMIPWRKIEVYKNELFFKINTVFLFPDLTYEVQTRLKNKQSIYTSNQIYKFKLKYNSSNELEHLNASPYFDRNYILNKDLKNIL